MSVSVVSYRNFIEMISTTFLSTWSGRFKAIEWIVVLILVLVLRFTFEKLFVPIDIALITYGTIIGFMIILSAIIVNRLLGADLSYLELIISALGLILFIAVAGVNIDFYNKLEEYSDPGSWFNSIFGGDSADVYNKVNGGSDTGPIAIGVLSIFTAIIFLVDLIIVIKTREFK